MIYIAQKRFMEREKDEKPLALRLGVSEKQSSKILARVRQKWLGRVKNGYLILVVKTPSTGKNLQSAKK